VVQVSVFDVFVLEPEGLSAVFLEAGTVAVSDDAAPPPPEDLLL
jgi:hypothetical protein